MKWKIVCCSAAFLVTASALAQVPNADTDEGREAQILVRNYMREHPSVSADEAATRLAVQSEVMPDVEALQAEFADRLIRTESGATRMEFEVGHTYTRSEFSAVIARHGLLFQSTIPGITGTTGLPGEERVLIDIQGDEAEAQRLKAAVQKLERTTGLRIEIRPSMPKSANAEPVGRASL